MGKPTQARIVNEVLPCDHHASGERRGAWRQGSNGRGFRRSAAPREGRDGHTRAAASALGDRVVGEGGAVAAAGTLEELDIVRELLVVGAATAGAVFWRGVLVAEAGLGTDVGLAGTASRLAGGAVGGFVIGAVGRV